MYLIVSDPPHGSIEDFQGIATVLHLTSTEVKTLSIYSAPKIISAIEDREQARELKTSLGNLGFNTILLSLKQLEVSTEQFSFDEFSFDEEGLLLGLKNDSAVRHRLLAAESIVCVVAGFVQAGGEYKAHREREKARKDKKKKKARRMDAMKVLGDLSEGDVLGITHPVAGAVSGLSDFDPLTSSAKTQNLPERSFLELFVLGDGESRRYNADLRRLNYSSLGERMGSGVRENVKVFGEMLSESFRNIVIDTRLFPVTYRPPVFENLPASRLYDGFSQPTSQEKVEELAMRLAFLSSWLKV